MLVLAYHAVSGGWRHALAVDPRALERQVVFLLERGYGATTFVDAVAGTPERPSFAITFDDAYRNVFREALPVLRALGVPATVFVPTAYVASEAPMRWSGIESLAAGPHAQDLLPMTWEELRQLAHEGWEVGSHGVSHRSLPALGEEELVRELVSSKAVLEERVGPCRSVAYPYGHVDERVIGAVRRAGYAAACTIPGRFPPARMLAWPRVAVYGGDGFTAFRLKISPAVRRLRRTRLWTPLDRGRQAIQRSVSGRHE